MESPSNNSRQSSYTSGTIYSYCSDEEMSIEESFSSQHMDVLSQSNNTQFNVVDNDLRRYPIEFNQICVPPSSSLSKHSKNLNKEGTIMGKIDSIDREKDSISIVSDNLEGSPQKFNYQLSKLKNLTPQDIIVKQVLSVSYTMSRKRNSKGVQNVENVFIDKQLIGEVLDTNWKKLTLIPRSDELWGRLIEDDPNLRPIKIQEAYKSQDEYMNTYFRLLRADCFSLLQKGIKDFTSGRLEHPDMNLYQNVSLVGCDTNYKGFSLTLSLTEMFGLKSRIKESLEFGTLLCLSPGGMFLDDPIWATVIQHDDNKELIVVQLCSESNSRSDSENMLTLLEYSDKIIMAESPSYYASFNPVLQSLQQLDRNNFPLYMEIIHQRSVPLEHDDYLPGDSILDVKVLYPERTGKIKLKKLLELLEKEPSPRLDSSQSQAIKYALTHRLAVIQGPPGCGKTMIGRILVEIILACDVSTVTPILVMTHKNHCLDEFLKHCLGFVNKDDIVRIGGGSQEVELDDCNLYQFKKWSGEVYRINREIKQKWEQIKVISDLVYRCSQISPESLLSELNEEQIVQLLIINHVQQGYNGNLESSRLSQLCSTIYMTYKEYFQRNPDKRNSNDESECREIIVSLIENWWPKVKLIKVNNKFTNSSLNQNLISSKEYRDTQQTRTESDDFLMETVLEHHRAFRETFCKENKSEEIKCWEKTEIKNLIELKDLPTGISNNLSLSNEDNLWLIDETTKLNFLGSIMKSKIASHLTQLDELLKLLKALQKKKEELQVIDKLKFVGNKLIVGTTIVGASIHRSLIQKLAPEVVIVDEAAEILEPNLLAALNPSMKHLVMIGDHMQLRPRVETHKLCEKYHFDTSMMERLIKSNYPFKCLNQQNRMRPEFAELLKDIYPNLKSNKEIVSQNTPPACMQKSMFFWCHSSPEMTESNGYSNNEEIHRILFLTLFLIDSGCEPTDITVLAPYQGQISRLKGEMKKYKECEQVVISTVDKYQGDENKYVIVSLVRSNKHKDIGFLYNFNRRCVAQSRAKCGLYFVANKNTFSNSKYWKPLIMAMDEQGCVGSKLGIRCPKHLDKSSKYVSDGKDLKDLLRNYQLLCKLPCGEEMPCKVHTCEKPCNSNHSHDECTHIVEINFSCNRHSYKRKCHDIKLTTTNCCEVCSYKMDCGIHPCNNQCSIPHSHSICKIIQDYNFPLCGHHGVPDKKKCYEPINYVCLRECIVSGTCEHNMLVGACFGDVSKCFDVCLKKRQCSHLCTAYCSDVCESKVCEFCEDRFQTTMNSMRVEAKQNVEYIDNFINKNNTHNHSFSIKEIFNTDKSNSLDYQKICDLVKSFLRAGSDWYPTITKIETTTNLNLLKEFETAKLEMCSTIFIDELFTLTDEEDAVNIAKNGFISTAYNASMQGRGIPFFADRINFSNENHKSKSFTKLLLCKVLLSKSLKIDRKSDRNISLTTLRKQQYDSVLVASTKDSQIDSKFIVYDPKQACPDYIITFEHTPLAGQPPSLTTSVDAEDSDVSLHESSTGNYQFARGMFYHRLALKGVNFDRFKVKHIEDVRNVFVEHQFKQKRKEFIDAHIPADTLMAFLGSDFSQNIQELIFHQQRFIMNQIESLHFNQIPDVKNPRCGDKLLLCQLVLGDQYLSAAHPLDASPILSVKHWNQVWPRYLIHLQ